MKRFHIYLSYFSLLLVLLSLMVPSAMAENSPGDPITEESQPDDQVCLNAVINNPVLATENPDGNEHYDYFWVTKEDGRRLDELEVGQTYTAHFYLRASGMDGGSLENLHVYCDLLEDPFRLAGYCCVFYKDANGKLILNAYVCSLLNDADFFCVPSSGPRVQVGDETIELNGQFYASYGSNPMLSGLEIAELRVGRENAIEITFDFFTESWDEYQSQLARNISVKQKWYDYSFNIFNAICLTAAAAFCGYVLGCCNTRKRLEAKK